MYRETARSRSKEDPGNDVDVVELDAEDRKKIHLQLRHVIIYRYRASVLSLIKPPLSLSLSLPFFQYFTKTC